MSKFDKALDELVINIGKDYEGWGKPASKITIVVVRLKKE